MARQGYHARAGAQDVRDWPGRDLVYRVAGYERWTVMAEEDICGLCGLPGADKFAHPEHWPGERVPDGLLVHADCEHDECARAHALLTDKQRRDFLRRMP
jgi:hypothetical protein